MRLLKEPLKLVIEVNGKRGVYTSAAAEAISFRRSSESEGLSYERALQPMMVYPPVMIPYYGVPTYPPWPCPPPVERLTKATTTVEIPKEEGAQVGLARGEMTESESVPSSTPVGYE